MTLFDAHANFAYGTVAITPAPAISGGSLTLTSGQGALMPAVPFNATVWAQDELATVGTAEIVRVTAITGDVLTITRAQEGSSARTIRPGDQFAATITAKTLTDVEVKTSTQTVSTQTAAYTAQAGDQVLLVDATSASFTVSLPSSTGTGRRLTLKAINAGANVVTVAAAGTDVIDGAASTTVGPAGSTAAWRSLDLIDATAGNWRSL